MIADPVGRGQALAEFWLAVCPRLWNDLAESDLLPPADAAARAAQRDEWEYLALHACVRGLVAAGGFDDVTARAVDALHERVLEEWMLDAGSIEAFGERRARLAERYAEYGRLDQESDADAPAARLARVGAAAARHVGGDDAPALAELLGSLQETLAAGAAEAVRRATAPPA